MTTCWVCGSALCSPICSHAQPLAAPPAPPSRRGGISRQRWPDGFVCPACGHDRGWGLVVGRWECAACGKETLTAHQLKDLVHGPIVTSVSPPCNSRPSSGSAVTRVFRSCSQAAPCHGRPDRSLLEDLIAMRPPSRSDRKRDRRARSQPTRQDAPRSSYRPRTPAPIGARAAFVPSLPRRRAPGDYRLERLRPDHQPKVVGARPPISC